MKENYKKICINLSKRKTTQEKYIPYIAKRQIETL